MAQVKEVSERNISHLLEKDGIKKISIGPQENLTRTRLKEIKKMMGKSSWAVRVVRNERFGGVLICQFPGEGNRLHYHPDSDECWVILEGKWEWYIEGVGTQRVQKDDIVVVTKGTKHFIKCVGDKPGIRFAITKLDVDHIYAQGDGRV